MRYSLIFCMPKLLEFVSRQLCGKTGSPANSEVSRDELREKCKWKWAIVNGVKGYKVTSKKNGNSIFLPAAGYRYGTNLNYSGSYGYYWSGSLGESYSDGAYRLGFNSGRCGWLYGNRYYGRSVRPVCE